MSSNSSSIHSTVPVVSTNDIEKSLLYYIETLGFEVDFKYGDPVVYAGIKSNEAEIYFSLDIEMINAIKERNINPEIFIWVNNADILFKKHLANGAEIVEPISNRSWGARQYVVKDINGYHLKFAQPL
jgi:uncharacterized glyoxalase superfamily protein PhnB